jgi:hypothetical protein
MQAKPAVLVLSIMLAASVASAKKQVEPKDYTDGKIIHVTREEIPTGVLSAMQGGAAGQIKFTYVIESTEGRYEAREYYNGGQFFRPLEASAGSSIQFRLNSKGRLMYVPLSKGEKMLEVMKFFPKSASE